MDLSQVALALYLTLVSGLLGMLTWSRVGRLEIQITELRAELRSDISELRAEFKSDINGLRSDLTLVALAVGVERPKPQSLG